MVKRVDTNDSGQHRCHGLHHLEHPHSAIPLDAVDWVAQVRQGPIPSGIVGARNTALEQQPSCLGKVLGGVKKLHGTAHWEAAKGNWEQNVAYCSKQEKVTEHGTTPMTNKRKGEQEKERWADAYKKAKAGNLFASAFASASCLQRLVRQAEQHGCD